MKCSKVMLSLGLLPWSLALIAGVRTLEVTENRTNGFVTSATVTFGEASGTANTLFLAYGRTAGGDAVGSWEHVIKVADVPVDGSSVEVAMPEGWGRDSLASRLFLADGAHADAFRSVAYIQGNGSARIPLEYVPTADTVVRLTFTYDHHGGNSFLGTDTATRFFQGAATAWPTSICWVRA